MATSENLSLTEKCGLLEFENLQECIEQRENSVNSNQLLFTITWTSAAGLVCIIGFMIFRKVDTVYQTRLEMPWIWVKPPKLRLDGFHTIWSWLLPVLQVTDQQLVRSCGMDAFVFMRVLLLCVQFLLPTAVVCCLTLMPIHYLLGHEIAAAPGNGVVINDIMVLSAFNLPKGSSLYWVHFVLALLICTWGCFLLKTHYQSIVRARQQHFFVGGEQYNPWVQQFLATDGEVAEEVAAPAMEHSLSGRGKMKRAMGATKDLVTRMGTFIFPAKLDENDDQKTLAEQLPERPPSEEFHGLQVPSRTLTRRTSGPARDLKGPAGAQMGLPGSRGSQVDGTQCAVDPSTASVPAAVERAMLATRNASLTSPQRGLLGMSRKLHGAIPEGPENPPSRRALLAPSMQKLVRISTLNDALKDERFFDAEQGLAEGEEDAQSEYSVASSFELSDAVYPWWQEYKRDPNLPPLLGKPTVRFRNMVNVLTDDGVNFAVNAQHYAVLVRDLPSYSLKEVMRELNYGFQSLLQDLGVMEWAPFRWLKRRKSFTKLKSKDADADMELAATTDKDYEAGIHDTSSSSAAPLWPSESSEEAAGTIARRSSHHKRRSSGAQALTLSNLRERFNPWLLKGYSPDEEHPGETWEERALRQDKEQLQFIESHFRKLFPDTFAQVVPVYKAKEVDYLLYQWDETIGRLDRALEVNERTGKHLKTSVGPLDEWLIGGCVSWWGPGYRFCCCFNMFCGWFTSKRHDAIEYLTKRKEDLEQRIAEKRRAVLEGPMTGTYFALFSSQRDAVTATETNMFSEGKPAFTIEKAPGPDEVNWSALWCRALWRRILRRLMVLPFVIGIVVFPVTLFTAAMGELDAAMCRADSDIHWAWYCDRSVAARKVVTLILPQIVIIAFEGLIMPIVLYYMTLARRSEVSFTSFEMHIFHIYYLWSIFNVFLGGLLGGTVFAQLTLLVSSPGSIWSILGIALASQASFFLRYIITRAVFMMPLKMLYPHFNVVPGLFHGLKIAKSRTPRQKAMQIAVHNLRYGREYGILKQVMFITLAFSITCPVILPISVIYYAMGYVIYRYQVMYVYERSYESGGMHWPAVFNRFCVSLWAFLLFTSSMLLRQEAFTCASLLLLIGTPGLYAFRRWCQLRYYPRMKHVPLDLADAMPKAFLDPAMYMPPSMRPGGVGWYPETGKVWEYWWMPLHSI